MLLIGCPAWEREEKFKLELSAEKTQVIKFTRFEADKGKAFTFLGFEFRWGRSRSGKPLITMRTSKKKFRAAIAGIQNWIKEVRCKLGTAGILIKLRQKLQGHWNYYGVRGNYDMLKKYYHQVKEIVLKWLNRRSQRKSCNWAGFDKMLKHFRVPSPRIIAYGNWTMLLYEASTTEEPCAGKLHAGICEGAAQQWAVLPWWWWRG